MTIRRFWTHASSEIQIFNPDPDPDGGRGNNNGRGRGASWTGRGRPPWAGGKGGGGADPTNGFRSAFIQSTTPTSTGNQAYTFTPTGDDWTPKLAIIMCSLSTALETPIAVASWGIGATDGTTEFSISNTIANGSASGNARRRGTDAACITTRNVGSDTLVLEASFVSFDTNGITLNFTTANASARNINILLLGGSEFSASVDIVNMVANNTAYTVTPGFRTRGALFFGMNIDDWDDEAYRNDGAYTSMGVGTFDGASTYTQNCFFQNRAVSAGDPISRSSAGAIGINSAGPVTTWGNVTSTQYDVTSPSNGSLNIDIACIAMNAGTREFFGGFVDTPTATGSHTFTDVGFTSKALFYMQTGRTAITLVPDGSDESGAYGWGAVDEDGNGGSISLSDEDGVATSDTEGQTSASPINLIADDGASTLKEASFTSHGATGPTFNFSTADASARKFLMFAIEE